MVASDVSYSTDLPKHPSHSERIHCLLAIKTALDLSIDIQSRVSLSKPRGNPYSEPSLGEEGKTCPPEPTKVTEATDSTLQLGGSWSSSIKFLFSGKAGFAARKRPTRYGGSIEFTTFASLYGFRVALRRPRRNLQCFGDTARS